MSVQQVQDPILILLAKLIIQTFSLGPELTPLFFCIQGDRSRVNSAKQLSSYLFPLPSLTGHSVRRCFPKAWRTNLETAHTVASLVQMGLIFL